MCLDNRTKVIAKTQNFSNYSNEELHHALDDALSHFSEEVSIDSVIQPILNELGARGESVPKFDAAQEWTNLCNQYPTLFWTETTTIPGKDTSSKHHRRYSRLVLLAAVLIVSLMGIVATQAAGIDVLGAMVHYTQKVFYLQKPATSEERPASSSYESLLELLERDGVKLAVVPSWLPADMTQNEISVNKNPFGVAYYATYISATDSMAITISDWENGNSSIIYEKNPGDIIVYESGGISHYLMNNYDTTTAVWLNGPFECSISTTLPMDTVKEIIDSIYLEEN